MPIKSIAKWAVSALIATALIPLSLGATAMPSAASVSPNSGPKVGGTQIEISGQDFLDLSNSPVVSEVAISFSGTVTTMSYAVPSNTTITATIPALTYSTGGAAELIVTHGGTTSTLAFALLNAFITESSVVTAPAVGSFNANLLGYSFSGNVSDAFMSTSNAVFSVSFTVTSDNVVSVSVPVIEATSRSKIAHLGLSFTEGSPVSTVQIELRGPTVSSTVPASGTAAGGNSVTISGQGFMDGANEPAVTKIMFGQELVTSASFTVVNDTTITLSLPTRSGNQKTVGANKVAVFYADDISSSQTVFYHFAPERDAAQDVEALVILGDLASRSKAKPVFRTPVAPFLVYGTDSLTNQPYVYETNYAYDAAAENEPGWLREGGEPGVMQSLRGGNLLITSPAELDGGASVSSLVKDATYTASGAQNGIVYSMRRDATLLKSNGWCDPGQVPWNNDAWVSDDEPNVEAYCSVFGPEVFSETFFGKAGQSLGFEWLAIGETDDYSIYAYLVAVQDETNIPRTDLASHTLVAHGVGSKEEEGLWTTGTADIQVDGLYRFRFTNGSFDGTGGKAIGSTFAISSVFDAGLTNEITFGPISDQIGTGTNFTVPASALSGGQVTVVSRNTNVCTVSTAPNGSSTTVTITKVSNGTCTLVASRALDGEYAPAADKLVAFEIRSSATSASAPVITQISSGDQQLGIVFAPPSRDGGFAVTNYQYSTDNGATWATLSPASTASSMVITAQSSDGSSLSNGVSYSIQVRAITDASQPVGAVSNTAVGIPNAPTAPVVNYSSVSVIRTIGVPTQILAPANSGGTVATWAVSSGSLPPGLTLNAATGIISGNPTTLGTSVVGITGTNSTATSNVATITITIVTVALNAPALTWSNSVIPEFTAYVGTLFTGDEPSNSNTVDSALFTVQPSLPAGLTINSLTGVVSGTATTISASASYVVTATNGVGSSTVSFILTVLPAIAGAGGTPAPGLTYTGPVITSIVPNVVSSVGGETVVVRGLRLGTGQSVTLGGRVITLTGGTATQFSFIMPALPAGVYDLVYLYDGGAKLTYISAITVVGQATVGESAPIQTGESRYRPVGKPWSAIGIASMFAPGSAAINPTVRAHVIRLIRTYAKFATTIECTGFTMGPSVLTRDAKLSRDRAIAVCGLIKTLRPRLIVSSAQGKQELKLGGEVRRVEVRFSR